MDMFTDRWDTLLDTWNTLRWRVSHAWSRQRDKHGGSWWLTCESMERSLYLSLYGSLWRRSLGGTIAVREINPGEWLISDVRVRERRRGLGTVLIRCAIKEVRRRGGTQLRGFVIAGDLEQHPFLVDWYERLGFTVHRAPPPEGGSWKSDSVMVARFAMPLRPVLDEERDRMLPIFPRLRRFTAVHSRPIMHWGFAFAAYCTLAMGALLAWPRWASFTVLWIGGLVGLLAGVRPDVPGRLLRRPAPDGRLWIQRGGTAFGAFCVLALALEVLTSGWSLLIVWAGAAGGLLAGGAMSLYHDFQRGVAIEGPRWLRVTAFVLLILAACMLPLYAMVIFTGPGPGQ